MKSNWKICTLGNLITFQRGYDLPKIKMAGGEYPVVGSNGIIGYHNKYTTEKPSITIGRSGNVGKPFLYNGRSWSHNTSLYIKEFKNVNPLFIYYLLQTLDLSHYAGGSAVPTLNRNHIHCLNVYIPIDLEIQKRIVSILSAIDNKIALNHKINQNLEQQAQAIFKSWFVDFEPFGRVMPDDWKNTTLGEVTINNREKIGNSIYPVFSAINTGNLVFSDEYFTKQVYSKNISNYIKVKKWDFAYNPARINIGSIGINELDVIGCVSPVYVVFSVQKEYHSFFRFYFKQEIFNMHCKARASGSVRQTLNYSDFALIDCIYPSVAYAKKFDDLWKSYYDIILKIKKENQKLSALRDLLLPKLINGEIDVSKIKI